MFQINVQNKPVTRSGILSTVGSVYDPLGFLAPFIASKTLCKKKHGWDEEIEHEDAKRWSEWLSGLEILSGFCIPRCIKPEGSEPTQTVQLHHFADASENGYATVSYIVMTNENNKKHYSFLMGKSRAAPLKHVTISRLELTAAVVAVKMDKMLKQELQMPLQRSVF